MSICHNFEGALMKAIRSLEQHVDSLMSYDFTQLTDEELLAELEIVDDRRIWKIAEAIRRGMPQSIDVYKRQMYEIPKDDSIGEVVITREYIEGNGGPKILLRGQEPILLEGSH